MHCAVVALGREVVQQAAQADVDQVEPATEVNRRPLELVMDVVRCRETIVIERSQGRLAIVRETHRRCCRRLLRRLSSMLLLLLLLLQRSHRRRGRSVAGKVGLTRVAVRARAGPAAGACMRRGMQIRLRMRVAEGRRQGKKVEAIDRARVNRGRRG